MIVKIAVTMQFLSWWQCGWQWYMQAIVVPKARLWFRLYTPLLCTRHSCHHMLVNIMLF